MALIAVQLGSRATAMIFSPHWVLVRHRGRRATAGQAKYITRFHACQPAGYAWVRVSVLTVACTARDALPQHRGDEER